jgi:hypothetical protein
MRWKRGVFRLDFVREVFCLDVDGAFDLFFLGFGFEEASA